jgi:hypothetical protein
MISFMHSQLYTNATCKGLANTDSVKKLSLVLLYAGKQDTLKGQLGAY